jgi:hypothetical protein
MVLPYVARFDPESADMTRGAAGLEFVVMIAVTGIILCLGYGRDALEGGKIWLAALIPLVLTAIMTVAELVG